MGWQEYLDADPKPKSTEELLAILGPGFVPSGIRLFKIQTVDVSILKDCKSELSTTKMPSQLSSKPTNKKKPAPKKKEKPVASNPIVKQKKTTKKALPKQQIVLMSKNPTDPTASLKKRLNQSEPKNKSAKKSGEVSALQGRPVVRSVKVEYATVNEVNAEETVPRIDAIAVEMPSLEWFDSMCSSLGLSYSYLIRQFWNMIEPSAVSVTSCVKKTHFIPATIDSGWRALSALFTGDEYQFEEVKHAINIRMYYAFDNPLNSISQRPLIEVKAALFSPFPVPLHFEFLAKLLRCRFAVFKNGTVPDFYGNCRIREWPLIMLTREGDCNYRVVLKAE